MCDKEEVGEVAAETRGHIGPKHFHRDRAAHTVALHLAAMHLGDGGCGNRGPEARKRLCQWAFQRCRDHRLGLHLRKGWQPVLQAFQVACHEDADHVGTGGEKLPELEVGRSHSGQRAGQALAGFGAAPFDQPRNLERELPGRRHQARIDGAEYALAREHEAGAGQPRDVGGSRDHKRQPECNATMPPERVCQLTRAKQAERIISANAFGLANLRMDSTRY